MENRSRKLTCWICSLSCVGQGSHGSHGSHGSEMAVDVMETETETVVAVVGLKGSGQGGEDPGGRGTEIGDL